ncbi:hypothetical protein CSKR_107776 [Clonorchis sinensis]|uniref:Uncharacterized protein n=1 Tax=Clonorchis sinensis TaxID=79923 RepID=A0A419PVJ8_CLOSI|nr:hypothetical protein CSKR_107776 [Clonorchis sinensis]
MITLADTLASPNSLPSRRETSLSIGHPSEISPCGSDRRMRIGIDQLSSALVILQRCTATGERKKTFAAELFIKKHQLNSYRPLDKKEALSHALHLQKLNIRLLLERVFLNFPGYSLTITQM